VSDAAPGRVLALAGASNFRDLGGYPTRDGQRVRWRCVFRADRLDELVPADWQQLQALGIETAIDLRAAHECASAPAQWPVVRRVALPIESALGAQLETLRAAGSPVDALRMRRMMQQEYRRMLLDHAQTFGELLRVVAQLDGAVVFHCAAGKDRTGLAAALLLAALGVDRATIEQDYMVTNAVYRRPPDLEQQAHARGLPEDALQVMWTVHASHLRVALDALDEVHGGLEPFLSGPVGLGPALRQGLADRLLENVVA